jgi:polyhydroxyalkanoate synthesis regulator phasin
MPDTDQKQQKTFDPFESFREVRDAYLDSVSKGMVEAVNAEAYARATGAMLDWSLTASEPFREAMEKSMLQVMQQLSLPSRQELAALAERFTNLELRVDDLDAKLDRVLELLTSKSGTTKPAEHTDREERTAGKTPTH